MNAKNITNSRVPRLITIAISHYCEKVRWALDWLKISYLEENHAPPFHRLYTGLHSGTSVPVLVTESGSFADSTDILHYLDTIAPEGRRLYPTDFALRQDVEELEELFDSQLGVSSRCWTYFYAIKTPLLVKQAWCTGVPSIEKVGCAIALPFFYRLVVYKYNVTEEGAINSLKTIRNIFETVNERLKGGKEYLVGDSFSATDLTFAALASPILHPKNHPVYSPLIRELPKEMVAVIQELRETPAGKFALRLYREHRKDFNTAIDNLVENFTS